MITAYIIENTTEFIFNTNYHSYFIERGNDNLSIEEIKESIKSIGTHSIDNEILITDKIFYYDKSVSNVQYKALPQYCNIKNILSETEYSQLTAPVQAMYTKENIKEDFKHYIEFYIININNLLNENPHYDYLSQEDHYLKLLNNKFMDNDKRILVSSAYGNRNENNLKLSVLEKPYNGETEKVYARKVNGGVYADRRHTIKPKYADSITSVTISSSYFPELISDKGIEDINNQVKNYSNGIVQILEKGL